VAEWLAGYSGLQIEQLCFRVLARVIALILPPTVLLSNQVPKWVPVNLMLGDNPVMD